MSNNISRQRFRKDNNAKPDAARRSPHVPRTTGRDRRLAVATEHTHVLMVRKANEKCWYTVRSNAVDLSGSLAFVESERERKARHWPADEFKVWTWPEAKRELRRKAWSVSDKDHIKNGARVMLAAAPEDMHPSLKAVRVAFGIQDDGDRHRIGIISSRNRRTGWYMVKLEGSTLSVGASRRDIIYPIPDNMVAFERRA